MIFCAHTQEGEGLDVPGTERHASSIRGEDTYVRLRQLWVFITRENDLLASFT